MVILGESGSGKTTLLNVLLGLYNYQGDILYKKSRGNSKKYKNTLTAINLNASYSIVWRMHLLFYYFSSKSSI
ncbi:hypothetical protein CAC02_10260 [Streptococcus gallolyticus]|uniref:ABC transporter domain-containing protein n=1 Tax=Streptococcus gallolyticus TaxID=315405 RepID=A0A368UAS4_9STRE|nr:hypothetical protein CAC02_10260 [Streptococcus gallolyticus]